MAAGAESIRPSQGSTPARPERLTPLRELQLVEACRKSGPAAHRALAELVRAYQRRVYTICLRMLRRPEDAADVTQDSLIKVIEGLGGYDGRSKLSTWVIRVTMNCCLSYIRRQRLRDHVSLDAPPGASGAQLSETGEFHPPGGLHSPREPLPHEGVEQAEARERVLRALDTLEPESRAILILRDMQELDYQHLAEVFEVPIGTIKSRLFRARTALRSALEECSPADSARAG